MVIFFLRGEGELAIGTVVSSCLAMLVLAQPIVSKNKPSTKLQNLGMQLNSSASNVYNKKTNKKHKIQKKPKKFLRNLWNLDMLKDVKNAHSPEVDTRVLASNLFLAKPVTLGKSSLPISVSSLPNKSTLV